MPASAAASAVVYRYDDGSAQLVINETLGSSTGENASIKLAVVLLEDRIVANFSYVFQLSPVTGLNLGRVEMRLHLEGTSSGYEGYYRSSIRDSTGTLEIRTDKLSYESTDNREVATASFTVEATGAYSAWIDNAYSLLSSVSESSSRANVTISVKIEKYEPGKLLSATVTVEGPKGSLTRVSPTPGISVPTQEYIAYADDYGLRLERADAYALIDNNTIRAWGVLVLAGDIPSLAGNASKLSRLLEDISDNSLSFSGVPLSSVFNPAQARTRINLERLLSNATLVLPTYIAFEANGGTASIALPRVKAESGDTAEYLKEYAQGLGAENVSVKQASPDKPLVSLPPEAEKAYESSGGGGALSSPTIALAAIVVIVLAVAGVLVLKARS